MISLLHKTIKFQKIKNCKESSLISMINSFNQNKKKSYPKMYKIMNLEENMFNNSLVN